MYERVHQLVGCQELLKIFRGFHFAVQVTFTFRHQFCGFLHFLQGTMEFEDGVWSTCPDEDEDDSAGIRATDTRGTRTRVL